MPIQSSMLVGQTGTGGNPKPLTSNPIANFTLSKLVKIEDLKIQHKIALKTDALKNLLKI